MKTNQNATKPREFEELKDKRAWTEIQKDAGYWQRFYDYAQRENANGNRVMRGSR